MKSLIGESKNVFKNGVIVGKNISREEYSRQSVERGHPEYIMSRGELMDFYSCPHRWLKGWESDETKATKWGDMIDCLTLTPDRFERDFAVAPATYEASGMQCPECGSITESQACRKCGVPRKKVLIEKEWNFQSSHCQEWKAAQGEKKIRTSEAYTSACGAVRTLWEKPSVKEVLEGSDCQVMVVAEYHDPKTKLVIPFRILIDILPNVDVPIWGNTIGDLKTGMTAIRWSKQIFNKGYHVQAASYMDVYNSVPDVRNNSLMRCEFFHVVQENFSPYECCRKVLSAEFLEIGRAKYRDALAYYAHCLDTGNFPGFADEVVQPEPWMLSTTFDMPMVAPEDPEWVKENRTAEIIP